MVSSAQTGSSDKCRIHLRAAADRRSPCLWAAPDHPGRRRFCDP